MPRPTQNAVTVYLSATQNNELTALVRISGLAKSDCLKAYLEYSRLNLDVSKLGDLPQELQEIFRYLKSQAQERHLRRLRRMAKMEWRAYRWIDDINVQKLPMNPWLSRYLEAEVHFLESNGWPLSCSLSTESRKQNRIAYLKNHYSTNEEWNELLRLTGHE